MLVLGLQGSPRIHGNTAMLLDVFLKEAARLGATTERLDIARKKISPCIECGVCEQDGFCSIKDDMQTVYPLLWEADLVIMATPIFFYGPTAHMKALIDRCQTPWARKYIHKVSDPGRAWRQGVLLSLGATKGKNLFDGTRLTARYFFDAFGAVFSQSLTYRKVESAGDIQNHPTAFEEAKALAEAMVSPWLQRKKVLFVGRNNACRSQMAGAFARLYGGDRLDVKSAGIAPADRLQSEMVTVMQEKGIDMAFKTPRSLDRALNRWTPDIIVMMEKKADDSGIPEARQECWDLEIPEDASVDGIRQVRDEIDNRVKEFLKGFDSF